MTMLFLTVILTVNATEKPLMQPIRMELFMQQARKDTVAGSQILSLLQRNYLGREEGIIEQIKKARSFFELRGIMEPLRKNGFITGYGKYATVKNPEDCYFIVYDPAGNIKAILGKGDNVRKNLITGEDDSISNYHGCGAIWFTVRRIEELKN
jgi:hypothetical protein